MRRYIQLTFSYRFRAVKQVGAINTLIDNGVFNKSVKEFFKLKEKTTMIQVKDADWHISYIIRQTIGRVRRLKLIEQEKLWILEGVSRTYYGKQLAQNAAMKVIPDGFKLDNQIEVS